MRRFFKITVILFLSLAVAGMAFGSKRLPQQQSEQEQKLVMKSSSAGNHVSQSKKAGMYKAYQSNAQEKSEKEKKGAYLRNQEQQQQEVQKKKAAKTQSNNKGTHQLKTTNGETLLGKLCLEAGLDAEAKDVILGGLISLAEHLHVGSENLYTGSCVPKEVPNALSAMDKSTGQATPKHLSNS